MVKEFLTREELVELDKTFQMVPLTLDFMFKNIFTDDLDILKEFLILETGLRLNPDSTKITILNGELPKENYKEYTGDESFLKGTTSKTDKIWFNTI